MDTTPNFATLLRQARVARDLTQEALAEQVGCATQTIRSFEIGRRRPSREMAERLASVLQLPAAERDRLLLLGRAPLAERMPEVPSAARPRPAPPLEALIGRHNELERLHDALQSQGRRLVTLLGPGGIGKSRLALQIGGDMAEHFADGVAFVALAPVVDSATLTTTIAAEVGCSLSAAPRPDQVLVDFLRDRELLLILDNLEQLLGPSHGEQVGVLLTSLLSAAPGLRLLITSRERLRLRDEWVIVIEGLALPDERPDARIERSDAVLLFLERARQVSSDFSLSPQNRSVVARICRLLGGMPLAIELAAAWVRVLSCEEIATEVSRGVDFLSAANRDLPPRHSSLRAVLDHSWQLLTNAERDLLARLAIFCGGARREAIASTLGSLLEASAGITLLAQLAALVDKSLVRRSQEPDGATRYDLHEFVRQYAAARLAEQTADAATTAASHAAYYAAWLAEQEHGLKSARQKATVAAIVAEIANVRAAWAWACAHADATLLRQMLPTLDWFYELRGWYAEAAAAFAHGARALHGPAHATDASELTQSCYWLMFGREGFHTLRRDPAFAVQRLQESVAMLRQVSQQGEQIHCIKGLAYMKMFIGQYAEAQALLDEGRAIATTRADAWNFALTLVIRGMLEVLRSAAPTARLHLDEALVAARAVGDPRSVSIALTYRGLNDLGLGQLAEAEQACREAHVLAAEHQDRFQISLSLQALGRVALAKGVQAEAEWLLKESLAGAREIGDNWLEAQALGCLGILAVAQGKHALARDRHRAAVAVATRVPQPIALDELAALAAFELDQQPAAARAALAYVRSHLLARPATQTLAAALLAPASAAQVAEAEAAALSYAGKPPTALLALFQAGSEPRSVSSSAG